VTSQSPNLLQEETSPVSLASPVQAWAGMVIVERDVFLSERFRLKHEPIIWKEHGKLQNREYRLLTTLKFIDIDILKSEVEQIVGVFGGKLPGGATSFCRFLPENVWCLLCKAVARAFWKLRIFRKGSLTKWVC